METPPNDRSLMRRVRNGDGQAAAQLHARYAPRMRGLAGKRINRAVTARFNTDDVVQSALGSFFRAAREGVYEVPHGGEIWQLLAAITRRKLSRAHARHTAAKRDARRTSGDGADEAATGQEEQLARELRLLIGEIMESYSDVQRRIVELRVENYDLGEIASRTLRSRRTVERVLQDFREELWRAYRDPADKDRPAARQE